MITGPVLVEVYSWPRREDTESSESANRD